MYSGTENAPFCLTIQVPMLSSRRNLPTYGFPSIIHFVAKLEQMFFHVISKPNYDIPELFVLVFCTCSHLKFSFYFDFNPVVVHWTVTVHTTNPSTWAQQLHLKQNCNDFGNPLPCNLRVLHCPLKNFLVVECFFLPYHLSKIFNNFLYHERMLVPPYSVSYEGSIQLLLPIVNLHLLVSLLYRILSILRSYHALY